MKCRLVVTWNCARLLSGVCGLESAVKKEDLGLIGWLGAGVAALGPLKLSPDASGLRVPACAGSP